MELHAEIAEQLMEFHLEKSIGQPTVRPDEQCLVVIVALGHPCIQVFLDSRMDERDDCIVLTFGSANGQNVMLNVYVGSIQCMNFADTQTVVGHQREHRSVSVVSELVPCQLHLLIGGTGLDRLVLTVSLDDSLDSSVHLIVPSEGSSENTEAFFFLCSMRTSDSRCTS